MHHCRCPSGFAVIPWRRAHADCRPLGAAARFNATIAAGKSAVSRATCSIYLSSGRGGVGTGASNTAASNNPGSGRTARRRADRTRSASRSHTVAANDGARPRESGAKHRTAQGEPAANSQRQFKSHRGAQGEPGRDKTRAREGYRARRAQDLTGSDAAGSDLAQARADAAGTSATSIPEGVDVRRLVAVAQASLRSSMTPAEIRDPSLTGTQPRQSSSACANAAVPVPGA